jgi:plastocyanin
VGATGQLTAAVSVGNNASQQVNWTTASAATATVDNTGKVTAVAAGTVLIRATAQADATKFAEANVTVTGQSFPNLIEVIAGVDAQFNPPTAEIARGGTVTWTFQTLAHTVNFDPTNNVPANIPASTSTSVSRTFPAAGTFTYQCTIHGGMTGTVIVH